MKNGRNAPWRKKKPLFGKYSNSTYQFNLTWKTLKRTHVPLQPENNLAVREAPTRKRKRAQRNGTATSDTNQTNFPSKNELQSHNARIRPRALSRSARDPSLLPVWSPLGGGTDRILLHGGGLRAVGVGSALPRRRVRAGLRRQVRPPLALLPASSLICLLPGAGVPR